MINCIAKDIMRIFNVNKFIETGIKEGDTANIVISWFSEMYKTHFITEKEKHGESPRTEYNIYEIDIDPETVKNVLRLRQNSQNIIAVCGDSADSLDVLIKKNEFTPADSCFFYLDAHTAGVSQPLIRELEQLNKLDFPFIVSIDDWSVPTMHDRKYKDMYKLHQIQHCEIFERTDVIYETIIPNVHSKQSCYIFPGYARVHLNPILRGLPLIETRLD